MYLIITSSFIGFLIMVAIITYFKTRNENLASKDGYFLGGRSLTGPIIAGSLMLTNLSAVNFIGMSAQAYSDNMCVMGWEVCSGITLVIVALFLVPRYLRQGITTIPDFLESRYDIQVKQFVTILFLFGYVVNGLPPTLYAGAVAMAQIFNIPQILNVSYTQGLWITVWTLGIIGAVYAIFGGLKAVAVSDTINGLGLLIGGLMVPVCGLYVLGHGHFGTGLAEIITNNTEKLNSVGSPSDPLPFATLFTGLLLVNLYYWGTDQSIMQRVLGAKNLEEGQKGVMWAGMLKIFTPFIVIIPGIIAFHLYKGKQFDNTDLVYSQFVKDVLPLPFVGFFAAVMFGAIMSTYNSILNSASTLFALNIYKPLFGKNKTDAEVVGKGKFIGIVLAVISMCVAPLIMYAPQGLFQYLQMVNGFFNVPIFTVIFIGYVTKKVPSIAAKIGLAIFVISYILIQFVFGTSLHFLHVLAILFLVCSALMLIIGWIKPRKTPFILEDNKLVDLKPWKYRRSVGFLIVVIMVCMYLLFSKYGFVSEETTSAKIQFGLIIAAVFFIFAIPLSVKIKNILGKNNAYKQ